MTTEDIFRAGNTALEVTMLTLFAIAVLVAVWMAIESAKDAAHNPDDWDF